MEIDAEKSEVGAEARRHPGFHLSNRRSGSVSENQYHHSPDDRQCFERPDNRHRRADHDSNRIRLLDEFRG